ncbi:biotin--[acetyl-CoA-carboxylase] ligase [Candidatus Symbiobacter mobilis]|uniref:biotin--[biotin carboxyl-carrier protein] ligase n=1 Tax=Candidatus Symbiobacter mobilis CR TaxID=946483 RepID=U5N8C5_9BURK|nr:biotin--[acetyl-CoA-carboxylase] ligase [Candidatus Symbiobacter mobilis]AGX87652.1 BirA family transcriptional regulator [Candidatus Symbiobacter mobilis CR]
MHSTSAAPWSSPAVAESLRPLIPGFAVEVVSEVDSTNSELMRRARAGNTQPTVLIACHQTQGKGRHGRRWYGSTQPACDQGPGSLTFSVGVALAPPTWLGFSLAAGWSVAQSLHPGILLKWPNDLWWARRKLAGILVETADLHPQRPARFVVVGVGINVMAPSADVPLDAASLDEFLPGVGALDTLLRTVPALIDTLYAFERDAFAPFRDHYQSRDALANAAVTLEDGTTGVALGVDADGALQVRTERGMLRMTSEEVRVHPPANSEDPPPCCG